MDQLRPPDEIARLVARAEAYWRERGSRMTYVRRLVCEEAFARRETFAAARLLDAVRRRDRAVSFASLYRTLADLAAAGLIRSVSGPGDTRLHTVAEQEAAAHAYLICTDCAQVIPLDDPCLAMRGGPAVRQRGFQAKAMTLRIEASCDEWRAAGRCRRAKPDGPIGRGHEA